MRRRNTPERSHWPKDTWPLDLWSPWPSGPGALHHQETSLSCNACPFSASTPEPQALPALSGRGLQERGTDTPRLRGRKPRPCEDQPLPQGRASSGSRPGQESEALTRTLQRPAGPSIRPAAPQGSLPALLRPSTVTKTHMGP